MVQKWNWTLSQIPVWVYLKNGIGLGHNMRSKESWFIVQQSTDIQY